jgi:hypothetical protein
MSVMVVTTKQSGHRQDALRNIPVNAQPRFCRRLAGRDADHLGALIMAATT